MVAPQFIITGLDFDTRQALFLGKIEEMEHMGTTENSL